MFRNAFSKAAPPYSLYVLQHASRVSASHRVEPATFKGSYSGTIPSFKLTAHRIAKQHISIAPYMLDVLTSLSDYADQMDVVGYKYVVVQRLYDNYIVFENTSTTSSATNTSLILDTIELKKEVVREQSLLEFYRRC